MSAWLEAVREVYKAGGRMPVRHMGSGNNALDEARKIHLIEPGKMGGPSNSHYAVLTQKGRDLMEGRLVAYVPKYRNVNGGRAPGTHRRWAATWLASLPRANEVRI